MNALGLSDGKSAAARPMPNFQKLPFGKTSYAATLEIPAGKSEEGFLCRDFQNSR